MGKYDLKGIRQSQTGTNEDEPQQIDRDVQLAAAAKVVNDKKPRAASVTAPKTAAPAARIDAGSYEGPGRGPERPTGKRSDPAYEKVGVYVQKDTRRRAIRKWEDEGGSDLSDLIETLLSQYIQR